MNQSLNPDLFRKELLFKDLNREAKKELRDKEFTKIVSLAPEVL